jgi:ribonuclease G
MANPKNRQQVEDALRQELERDRTKTYVVEISPLGLVEMTRQNVTDGPREVMTRKCPTCDGDGIIVSEGTAAVEVERRIRALVTPGSRAKAFKVEVSAKIVGQLVGPDGSRLRELEELTKRRFFLVGLEDAHLDHMRLLEQGTVEKLAPPSPVEVGQEIELKLGEVGLHDARAGVGKVKGTEVVVADAAKLVGKKVKVRVVAVTEGAVYAVQVGPADELQPITAEAEAERPTRAKRPVKTADAADPVEEETVEAEPVEAEAAVPPKRTSRRAPAKKPVEAAAEGEAEQAEQAEKPASRRTRARKPAAAVDAEAAAEAEEAEAPAEESAEGEAPVTPRKRTRRGTRGGRGRKRKPTAGATEANGDGGLPEVAETVDAATEAETEAPEPPEAAEPVAPVIHLPDRDLGENGDEPGEDEGEAPAAQRKRTRRGTRGGRGRKRPAAVAAGEEASGVEEAAPADEGEGNWEYTPMSEWGDV